MDVLIAYVFFIVDCEQMNIKIKTRYVMRFILTSNLLDKITASLMESIPYIKMELRNRGHIKETGTLNILIYFDVRHRHN